MALLSSPTQRTPGPKGQIAVQDGSPRNPPTAHTNPSARRSPPAFNAFSSSSGLICNTQGKARLERYTSEDAKCETFVSRGDQANDCMDTRGAELDGDRPPASELLIPSLAELKLPYPNPPSTQEASMLLALVGVYSLGSLRRRHRNNDGSGYETGPNRG